MADIRAMETGTAPASPRPEGLWTVLNRPRSFDATTVQILSGIQGLIFVLMAVLRHDPAHPEFAGIRGAIALIALCGVLGAPRFDFRAMRLFTVILGVATSLVGGYVAAAIGNDPTQLPLTGLATFVGVGFLQTGRDVVLVVPALALAHSLFLAVWPPLHVPLSPVVVMIGSALIMGAGVSMVVVGYSGRLNERIAWWQAACERERAALRAKSEFLSTMSHELRSPLHVIVGYADMIHDEVAPGLRESVARIRRSALDLLQLVENTMNAARLEAGKLQLHMETFDPGAVFDELAENVRALPEAKRGVPVRWRVAAGLPAVHLDRLKLKEIVQNLVSNALKFTREGEVTVDVAAEDSTLRLAVRDTGPGISASAQATIFEMFERVEAGGGTHRPPGVGLGLYIVRSLVQLMGGTIVVESAPAAGTCFTVRLPVRTPSVAAAA
jgi:signal transduction histidine kinase